MSSTAPPISGGCLCRALTYTFTSGPINTVICHCPNCKAFSGTSFMCNIRCPSAAFTLNTHPSPGSNTVTSPTSYNNPASAASSPHSSLTLYEDIDTESGRPILRYFCNKCGSSLFLTSPGNPEWVIVAMGTLNRGIYPSAEELGKEENGKWRPYVEFFEHERTGWLERVAVGNDRGKDH